MVIKRWVSVISVIIFLFSFSSAYSDVNLSDMTLSELSDLRDKINQEINERKKSNPLAVIETFYYKLTFTGVEVVDKDKVNEYYEKSNSMFGCSGDSKYFLMTFDFENRTNYSEEISTDRNASINGWIVGGFSGLRGISIPASKKTKGFVYFSMENCEASSIDDVDSVEFVLTVSLDNDKSNIMSRNVKVIKTEDGYNIMAY